MDLHLPPCFRLLFIRFFSVHSNNALFDGVHRIVLSLFSCFRAASTGNNNRQRSRRSKGGPRARGGCGGLQAGMAEGSRNNNQDQDAEGTQGNPVRPHDTLGYYAKLNVGVDCTRKDQTQVQTTREVLPPGQDRKVRAPIGVQHNTNTDANNENQQGEDDEEYGVTQVKQGLAFKWTDGAACSFAKPCLRDARPGREGGVRQLWRDGLAAGRTSAVDERAPSLRRVRERMERTKCVRRSFGRSGTRACPSNMEGVRYRACITSPYVTWPPRAWPPRPARGRRRVPDSNATVSDEGQLVTLGGQMGQSMTQGSPRVVGEARETVQHTLEAACACQLDPGALGSHLLQIHAPVQCQPHRFPGAELLFAARGRLRVHPPGGARGREHQRLGERLYGDLDLTPQHPVRVQADVYGAAQNRAA